MTPGGWGASEGDTRDYVRGEISDADIVAVLDAVDFERPALVAEGSSGGVAIHFSATHPERVSALVLINSFAHYVRSDDYPWGVPPEILDRLVAATKESWGTAAVLEVAAPDRVADERFRAWYARSARFTGGPDRVADMLRAGLESDVRSLLHSISCPTLVLHREGNRYIRLGAGRYLAEHIPGAKFVALPGNNHLFYVGDADAMVDEIEEFLTGARSRADADVVLVAVLFTDIVASTDHLHQGALFDGDEASPSRHRGPAGPAISEQAALIRRVLGAYGIAGEPDIVDAMRLRQTEWLSLAQEAAVAIKPTLGRSPGHWAETAAWVGEELAWLNDHAVLLHREILVSS